MFCATLQAAKKKTAGRPRGTKNSGAAPAQDDDDICVVEEKLTPMARMKAKVGIVQRL